MPPERERGSDVVALARLAERMKWRAAGEENHGSAKREGRIAKAS